MEALQDGSWLDGLRTVKVKANRGDREEPPADNEKRRKTRRLNKKVVSAPNERVPNPVEYKGVHRNREAFQARINVGGEFFSVGNFPTVLEAARAYDIAVIGMNVWQKSWSGLSTLNFPPNSFSNDEIENVKSRMKRRYGDDLPAWHYGVYVSDTGFGAFLDMELEILHLGTYPTVDDAARARDLAGIASDRWKKGDEIMNFPDMEYTAQEMEIWKDWLTRRGERKDLEHLPEGLPNNRNSYWSVRALVNQCFLPKARGAGHDGVPTPEPAGKESTVVNEDGVGSGINDEARNRDPHSVSKGGSKRKVTLTTEDGETMSFLSEGEG